MISTSDAYANVVAETRDWLTKAVIGLNMLNLWDDRGSLGPWIASISEAIDNGTIHPIVHAAVPFAEAPEAHRILAARENFGKVVLVP